MIYSTVVVYNGREIIVIISDEVLKELGLMQVGSLGGCFLITTICVNFSIHYKEKEEVLS